MCWQGIKYEIRPCSTLNDSWMLENIGSSFASIFPNAVATVLGKALLWAILDEEINKLIDGNMVARVKAAIGCSHGSEAVV